MGKRSTSTVWDESLTAHEERILRLCKKQKLWGFLRRHRHLLFDSAVTDALDAMYSDSPRGRPPKDARQKALAMLLQVVCDVGDHEVPTLTVVDQRWQVVLGCHGITEPLLSQGTVFDFRMRSVQSGFMGVLLERTVSLARETKGFSHKRLRAVIDSSPLLGSGRVEDTFNLIGRGISQLANAAAAELDTTVDAIADKAGVSLLSATSVKGWLDLDWSDAKAGTKALTRLVEQFDKLRTWLVANLGEKRAAGSPLGDCVARVEALLEQDTEPDPDDPGGALRIRRGTSADRQISVSDPDMRHGRKTKKKTFNGYKRHIVVDADIPGLVHATHLVPANVKEHAPLPDLLAAVEEAGSVVTEVHVDRGYIASEDLMERRRQGLTVVSKPLPSQNNGLFPKSAFDIDIAAATITCPAGETAPIKPNKTGGVWFSTRTCAVCDLRAQCTTSKKGRSIRVHPEEEFHQQLRADAQTPEGRARTRQRIPVEHALARVGQVQGRRARYRGLEKNGFDLDRAAVIANCYVLGRLLQAAA